VPIDVLADRLSTTRGASTKHCTTPVASFAHTSPRTGSISTPCSRRHADATTRVKQALGRLLGPNGVETGCDECFKQLDHYVELEVAGRNPDAELPGLRAHLTGCPARREEHDSLHALISGEQAL
jgi:hypothetical protein